MNQQSPIRTCIGCRERAVATDLLRVVVAPDGGHVVPDPRRRMPGRGAWVHDDRACVDQAIRRRAFGRAFGRAQRVLDAGPVCAYVAR